MSKVNPSNLPARTPSLPPAIAAVREAAAAHSAENAATPEAGTDWRRVRSALWRYKWLMFVLPPLAAAGGYGASKFLKPTYTVRATVWLNKQSDGSRSGSQGEQFGSDAWLDLFRSYAVIDRVVSDRHLSLVTDPPDSALVASFDGLAKTFTPGKFVLSVDANDSAFVLSGPHGDVLDRGRVGDSVGAKLGFIWTPPASALPAGATFSLTVLSPRQASLNLLDRLHVTIDGTGTFLHAELTGTDPAGTSATLNSIVQQFVDVAVNLKSEGLVDRMKVLSEQLGSAQRNLSTAESALEQFRLQSVQRLNANSSTQQRTQAGETAVDPAAAAYVTTQASLDAIARQRQTIRRVLSQAGDSELSVAELEGLPAVVASSELSSALKDLTTKRSALRALRLKYTDSHPLVVAARAEIASLERVDIPAMANRVVAGLNLREAELSRSAVATRTTLQDAPAQASTEARLERNVTIAAALYSQLQPQFAEAQVARESAVPEVRPLDPAEAPQYPDIRLTARLVLATFLAGLGLAIVIAITLDRFDPKFRYPDQVSRELGLTILGALPHLSKKGKRGKRPEENSAFQEAIRDVRMNVEFAYGSGAPWIFTISSAGPADGKSFLSCNLARAFAESGRKTLLIDADLRRGELHRRCGLPGRRPGLTDCLRGEASIDAIIQQTGVGRFDVVAGGTRLHDAPELLGSPVTAQLFGEFRRRYDVIIVDSPPLSAGIDPFVLAALSGNLLLMVRTGVSVREVIEAKLDVLSRMPVRFLGVVLNDVPRGSSYGYYSSYVAGYDTSDETGMALQRIIE